MSIRLILYFNNVVFILTILSIFVISIQLFSSVSAIVFTILLSVNELLFLAIIKL